MIFIISQCTKSPKDTIMTQDERNKIWETTKDLCKYLNTKCKMESSFKLSLTNFLLKQRFNEIHVNAFYSTILELAERENKDLERYLHKLKPLYVHFSDYIAKRSNEKTGSKLKFNENTVKWFLREYYKNGNSELYALGLTVHEANALTENMSKDKIKQIITSGDLRFLSLPKERILELVAKNKRTDVHLDQHDFNYFDLVNKIKMEKYSFVTHDDIPMESQEVFIDRFNDYLIFNKDKIYTKYTYKVEKTIAQFIKSKIGLPNKRVPTDNILNHINDDYNEDQKKAIISAIKNKVSIISGHGGTGKTTILKSIYNILTSSGLRVVVLSFTGKAVKRVKEITGISDVFTIHRFIALYKMQAEPIEHLINFDYIIFDETSMISCSVMHKFIRSFDHSYSVCFVGDEKQLSPIDYGNLFQQLICICDIPHVKLEQVYRNKGSILNNSLAFAGQRYQDITSDEDFIILNKDNYLRSILESFKSKNIPFSDFKIVSYKNDTVAQVNGLCKEIFFGHPNLIYEVGDLIMYLENDYHNNVFNGEEGMIVQVKPKIKVKFGNSTIELNNSHCIQHSYGITVHKSQGSQWNYVIYYLDSPGIYNQLSYTASTRAKSKLIIIDPSGYYPRSCNKKVEVINESLCDFINDL